LAEAKGEIILEPAYAVMKEKIIRAPAAKKTKGKMSPPCAKSGAGKVTVSAVESKPKTRRTTRKPAPAETPKAPLEVPKRRRAAATPKSATKSASPARRRISTKLEVPSILLEDDNPPTPSVAGPGEKFSLGPSPVTQKFDDKEGELPEAYGTRKLFLTARDPHWLYAHWDLTREQQSKLNLESGDGCLVLRLYANALEGHPAHEIHVHPDSRHWFAHVDRAGDSYVAELGYYSPVGRWMRVAVSAATLTPPDAASLEAEEEFATIPFEFPFARLLDIIKSAVREHLPLSQAIEELRRVGHPDLPRVTPAAPPIAWTPQQEQALAKIVSIDDSRRVWMGSLEITELIRRRLAHDISSAGVSSFSNPPGVIRAAKEFWFNVNAELIIYGATDPGAKVTLGGHEIKLRPDGTFSYRFSLPDGKYDLPAVAVSSDDTDGRAANLKFSRETEYLGDVGAHPQDPSLKPPLPENL
jgi:hypothetical protein